MNFFKINHLFLLSIILVSCSTFSISSYQTPIKITEVSQEELDIPEGHFSSGNIWSVIWTKDGNILIFVDTRHETYLLNNNVFELINVDRYEEECSRAAWFYSAQELPDERIGWLIFCNSSQLPNKSGEEGAWAKLVALDLNTNEQELLVKDRLPRTRSYWFSFAPDMGKGIVSAGSSEGTLYWINPGGSLPLDLSISNSENGWNLSESYLFEDAEDNPEIGIASSADWSMDGSRIAFFASLDAIGKLGFARSDSMRELYIMDSSSLEYEAVLAGIFHPSDLRWSPQGDQVAFLAHLDQIGHQGIWIYSTDEDQVYEVAQGDFRELDWSPDGMSLVAIQCFEVACWEPKFVVFRLPWQ